MTREQIRNCNPKILRRMCWWGVKVRWMAELCGLSERWIFRRLEEYKLKIQKNKRI